MKTNTTYHNLGNTTKSMLRGKFKAQNVYIKRKRLQINHFDVKYNIENIVNNVAATLYSARWVLN